MKLISSDIMTIILTIFGLAAVILLLYFVGKMILQYRNSDTGHGDTKVVTSTRLRAYERLTLLLERINPNSLLVNHTEAGMSCIALQSKLLNEVRREFEHNASQQIYVSELLWEELSEARESLTQLINSCAAQCKPDEPAQKLASMILEIYNTPEETAISAALRHLKEEVKELF